MRDRPTLQPKNRAAWRTWLSKHHDSHEGVYLLVAKKHRLDAKPGLLSYEDALDEALCFGWIDGHVRYHDEDWRAIRFTPRREGSIWSERNKVRVARLEKDGRMTKHGRRHVELAKENGEWQAARRRASLVEPKALTSALKADAVAHTHWMSLPPSHKKQWLYWVTDAKKPETKARRIAAVVRECAARRRPGMQTPSTKR